MRKIIYTCACSRMGEYNIAFNAQRVLDETIEFAQSPSKDELSDILINLSCLLHSVFPNWVWLLPGAGRAQDKGIARFIQHGCCRSKKHSCNQ